MGIEPTYPAWKAGVLPLNYTRILKTNNMISHLRKNASLFFNFLITFCPQLNCKVKFHPSMEFNPAKRCISKGGI